MEFGTPHKTDLSTLPKNTIVLMDLKSQKMLIRIIVATLTLFRALARSNPGGIHFKFEKKNLLAESFTRIKFLVPFPKEPVKLNSTRRAITGKIEELRAAPTIACELNGTDPGNNLTTSIEWIESVLDEETRLMKRELTAIYEDLKELLDIHATQQSEQPLMRKSRLAAAAVAVGAASVFGGGMAV